MENNIQIIWADHKKVIDMTQVFLTNCCPPGNPAWLLEDKDFIRAILFGASSVCNEGAYIDWLAKFIAGLSKESKYFANKVSLLRILKNLPEIERKRPDLYKVIKSSGLTLPAAREK